MRYSYVRPFDNPSPIDPPTPCSKVEVTTPSSPASPNDAPSPTIQIAKDSLMIERACMFAQGHHEKLLSLLNGEEKRILSDWLYQYWFFCFKTAKHWGKGPTMWTAKILNFDQYFSTAPSSLPVTAQDARYLSSPHNNDEPTPPSDLCRWYIHAREEDLESISEADFDLDDDRTWPSWPPNELQASLQTRLRNALEHNDFSATPATDLPVAIPEIAKATDGEQSSELLVESLGFSIISRNLDQIDEVIGELWERNVDLSSLHPFHLAASFLDGYKSCCDVIGTLSSWTDPADLHKMYLNEHGHTVLDNLMISIIKSHTTARPVDVDENLRNVARFIGEEVDICGRWDADSPCVRQLYAHGRTSVPPSWKHKFCNTSIQAICHCIDRMFQWMPEPLLLQTPSGLYVRRCFGTDCGKKLQLQPLHSLVMTAYHLATQGRDGEDLFGILACVLCLISHGLNPSVTANISVAALLSSDSFVECDHVELTATELAEEILALPVFGTWDTKIKTGWVVLTGILRRCEVAHLAWIRKEDHNLKLSGDSNSVRFAEPDGENRIIGSTEPDELLEEMHYQDCYSPCFTGEKNVGTLWSSVKAELLSYRRLNNGLGWTSQYFSMETLREQLEKDENIVMGYAEHNLLKPHCACHSFGRYGLTLLSDAVDPHLANLDVWERATYGPFTPDNW
ncbi:hypothetical protein IG631_21540 [Alternaria alternata]|nr:hypothetical protein IG631_21540 [Alternaria alternata]